MSACSAVVALVNGPPGDDVPVLGREGGREGEREGWANKLSMRHCRHDLRHRNGGREGGKEGRVDRYLDVEVVVGPVDVGGDDGGEVAAVLLLVAPGHDVEHALGVGVA